MELEIMEVDVHVRPVVDIEPGIGIEPGVSPDYVKVISSGAPQLDEYLRQLESEPVFQLMKVVGIITLNKPSGKPLFERENGNGLSGKEFVASEHQALSTDAETYINLLNDFFIRKGL